VFKGNINEIENKLNKDLNCLSDWLVDNKLRIHFEEDKRKIHYFCDKYKVEKYL